MADSAALLVDEVLAHKVGYAKPLTETGAVTLILRFGSALNLNIYQPNRDHRKMRIWAGGTAIAVPPNRPTT
jgi:hypothetical protein